jgi:nicotinamidase-related amidase
MRLASTNKTPAGKTLNSRRKETSNIPKMAPTQKIGHDATNFWCYEPGSDTIDLSRGSKSKDLISLRTTTQTTQLDPEKTALLLIDLQNFFLHSAVRPRAGDKPTPAEAATNALLSAGIPAARHHGIQVIWLCWGLTENDLRSMPPAIMRTFSCYESSQSTKDQNGDKGPLPSAPNMVRTKNPALYKGLGTDIGAVELADNKTVPGGRVLMRDTWNATLYDPFDYKYRESQSKSGDNTRSKPDVLFHKNRMSGLWGSGSELESFLQENGIRTLVFGGVNTDQCVGSTLTDAFSKGYDCILLRDGVGTGTPFGASEVWEWNVTNCWGFVSTCEALRNASRYLN